MINLIKALNYQIKNNNLTYIIFIIAFALGFIPFLNDSVTSKAEINGGIYYIFSLSVTIFIFVVFNILMITQICGFDMKDKTINYEIMSGHSKTEVYFSRVITAYMWSVTGVIVATALPLVILSIFNGWGKEVIFSEFICRYIVFLFHVVRLFGFEILFTFIVQSWSAAAFISYFLLEISVIISMVLEELLNIKLKYIFAFSDMMNLSDELNYRNIVIDGENITRYDLALSPGFVIISIAVSVVMAAVYIMAGYIIFKKRDMR